MARVNVGIDPKFLSDQHLIAESVEITMITGSLRKNGYQIKSPIPDSLALGKGHINFFKNKLAYLHSRLREVNNELTCRGIRNSTEINLNEFPKELWWNPKEPYEPSVADSSILRLRVIDRLKNPRKAKPGFHRYYKNPIENIDNFCIEILKSPLYYV